MLSRQEGLEQDVVDDTARSLVPMLLSNKEAKRQSVVAALTGLDVSLDIIVEALLPVLEDTDALTQVRCQSNQMNALSKYTFLANLESSKDRRIKLSQSFLRKYVHKQLPAYSPST